ncbi:MAG: cob(I)yrinic acid a,c-diamide adenosyltransferase [Phycisphaerae bacterium]|nr:cob(I)yrinic acid a,c-diamide adenosyltransferase [Planctomycetota bacterium]MBL7220979.1 cob(I)yrinic acid a,c-diamide adenosyltransferase [Phycisphaerae bacterium]
MGRQRRIVLLTGDGKGKTCAALGMSLRAAGHGMRVMFLQFLKNDTSTGEIAALAKIPEIDIVQAGLGFVPKPENPRFSEHHHAAEAALQKARDAVESGGYSTVVLDEVCGAVACGLIAEADVLDLLDMIRTDQCLVLTGRGATPAMIEAADTVTDLRHVKHAYDSGLPAQKGVEL